MSYELVPGSKGVTYLEQNEVLAKYLKTEVYKEEKMPEEYKEAITQFEDFKEKYDKMSSAEKIAAEDRLPLLGINQLFRRTPCEVLYDALICFENTGTRLLEREWDWLSVQQGETIIAIGSFDKNGLKMHNGTAFMSITSRGFVFSRVM